MPHFNHLETSMETLIEQSVCTNTRCYTCGALVYDVEKKKTTNHIYHHRCFCCRICKRNLTASSLNEEGDDIYCANCYRKKQRGDCNSLDFQHAASERSGYIYTHRHPDQPSPISNPRRPIQHDLSRHPSWTLRQLERKFLSLQPSKSDIAENTNEKYRKTVSITHPLTLKTSFSMPINLAKFQLNSTFKKAEPSPLLHFSPVFSPFPNSRTQSTASTPKTPKQINSEQSISSIDNIRSRLNQSSIDLTNTLSPTNERKHSIVIDLNGNKDQRETKFRFPDVKSTPSRRRSSNTVYLNNRLNIK